MLKSGEAVFLATAMSHNAAQEYDYYQSRINGGLLYVDENKIAGLGLEEETESILRTRASGDDVKGADDFSLWRSTQDSISKLPPPAQLDHHKLDYSTGWIRQAHADTSHFVQKQARHGTGSLRRAKFPIAGDAPCPTSRDDAMIP